MNTQTTIDISARKRSSRVNFTWHHIEKPNNNEIDNICSKYDIPDDFIRDPLDKDERSRIEIENGSLLIIIRVPLKNKGLEIPFVTIPLGIILPKEENKVLTVSSDEALVKHIIKIRQRNCEDDSTLHFIFNLIYKIAILYIEDLKSINNLISEYENHLRKSMRNQELIRLFNLEKSLVYFTTSLKSNEMMLEKMRAVRQYRNMLNDVDIETLDDIIIEYKQALETSMIYSNVLSGMMDAFASVISNNLNQVMKFLTSFAIVLTIPIMLSGIYGMNVALPLQRNPHAFSILILSSVILSGLTALVFVWKKWF
ncbi:MAG: magnesium transporter CorA [bacterium]|nr:MAG: magnesium transporter CorA [bacterium]